MMSPFDGFSVVCEDAECDDSGRARKQLFISVTGDGEEFAREPVYMYYTDDPADAAKANRIEVVLRVLCSYLACEGSCDELRDVLSVLDRLEDSFRIVLPEGCSFLRWNFSSEESRCYSQDSDMGLVVYPDDSVYEMPLEDLVRFETGGD